MFNGRSLKTKRQINNSQDNNKQGIFKDDLETITVNHQNVYVEAKDDKKTDYIFLNFPNNKGYSFTIKLSDLKKDL